MLYHQSATTMVKRHSHGNERPRLAAAAAARAAPTGAGLTWEHTVTRHPHTQTRSPAAAAGPMWGLRCGEAPPCCCHAWRPTLSWTLTLTRTLLHTWAAAWYGSCGRQHPPMRPLSQGSGAFGVVHEATWRGRCVAVKLLAAPHATPPEAARALRTLRREVELRAACASPRLVRVYAACLDDPRKSCVVMELMQGGSLAQRIHDRDRPPLTYHEVLHVVQDVAEGLAHLHPLVVHRDLKPQVRSCHRDTTCDACLSEHSAGCVGSGQGC